MGVDRTGFVLDKAGCWGWTVKCGESRIVTNMER